MGTPRLLWDLPARLKLNILGEDYLGESLRYFYLSLMVPPNWPNDLKRMLSVIITLKDGLKYPRRRRR